MKWRNREQRSSTGVLIPPRCTVCAEAAVDREPFYYDWRNRRFWLYRCRQCTHQFVDPPVSAADQALIYADSYFERDGDWSCGVFRNSYVQAEAALRREARRVLAFLPQVAGGNLLDIGCAGGVFLDEARAHGFAVTGIELNPTMADHARRTYGLEILTGRLETTPVERWHRAFDVVTLMDCLEHLPEPRGVMERVARWIRPTGWLLVRGPLANRPLAHLKEALRRLIRLPKRLPGYPLDANTFNKRSLTTLLRLTGFEPTAWIGEAPGFANLLARADAQRPAGRPTPSRPRS
ncbi:MAG: class I SAM-dependent methyltransferase [Gemmatimonadales bacterium]